MSELVQQQAEPREASQPISQPVAAPDPIALLFQAWIRPNPADAMRSLDIAASTRGVSDEELAELMFLCFRAGHLAAVPQLRQVERLESVLEQIVDAEQNGRINDVGVRDNGVAKWLIDELAREVLQAVRS